jgi:hypothetical protein
MHFEGQIRAFHAKIWASPYLIKHHHAGKFQVKRVPQFLVSRMWFSEILEEIMVEFLSGKTVALKKCKNVFCYKRAFCARISVVCHRILTHHAAKFGVKILPHISSCFFQNAFPGRNPGRNPGVI